MQGQIDIRNKRREIALILVRNQCNQDLGYSNIGNVRKYIKLLFYYFEKKKNK